MKCMALRRIIINPCVYGDGVALVVGQKAVIFRGVVQCEYSHNVCCMSSRGTIRKG